MARGYLCGTNGKKQGCGKRHTRYCRAYKSCKSFIGITKRGGSVRDRKNTHMHLCNGGEIWDNVFGDYFSVPVKKRK